MIIVLFAAATAVARVPVIVALREGAGKKAAIAAAQDAVLQQLAPSEFTLVARWNNIPAFAAEIDRAAIERLQSDPLVRRIDPDVGGSAAMAESVPLIGGDRVHSLGYTGRGVTVAVLDSGVDSSHPDLAGRIVDEQCFCRNSDGTGCCPNGQTVQGGAGAGADDHGHGSNVAGIVGSRGIVAHTGVAPEANLVIIKVLDRNGRFQGASQVISGLDWLIDNHPEVRVVNMSLVTDATFSSVCDSAASFTMAFASAINTLRQRGTITFVCSGNNASPTVMTAPACIDSAVSVGAVYDSNVGSISFFGCADPTTTADQITCFSNSNSTLDLLAPGAVITSDWLHGGLSNFLGTSQASPHAAGSAAVLLEVRPSLAPDQIESLLKSTGKPILDPRNGVVAPRIDLLAAVSTLLPAPDTRHRAVRH
ncbi:MAG TPA: S8 family serine peptidase [Thermoanaerobaculia bacterium]